MRLFLLTIIFLFSVEAFAQGKVNKQTQKLYQEAINTADEGDLKGAISILTQLLKTDKTFIDAWLSRGGIYGQLRSYKEAVADYEEAFRINPSATQEYKLPYSINLAGIGQFEKALNAVNEFAQLPTLNEASKKAAAYRKACYQFALEYARKNPAPNYVFSPQNLGDSVNTRFPEYFPSLTIDGHNLIFTRQLNFANEDFFGTNKNAEKWSMAKPLPGGVNTTRNEGAQNISQDGTVLVFTSCDAPEGYGSCDLYYSLLTRKGWSDPINMGGVINSEFWESQPSIAPDKRALYFAARRQDGFGGSDIYVSYLMPNGKWGPPLNMGPAINTAGDETSPFIHADNQTLYFGSNGLPGYGKMDLFVIRKDSAGHWNKPMNLGYPINTIDDEATLCVSADGTTAYYASDRSDSRGALDLYSFTLREDIRPIKTLWIKGKVFDSKTKAGLPSAVELKDITTGQRMSKVQTDEEGNYLITLPIGRDYAFLVNRKNYLMFSENFPLASKRSDSTYIIDIPLQPIEVNAQVVLKNIFFETGKFDLKKESESELENLFDLLTENPSLTIQINGHTDNVGKPADNLILSNNRSKAVVNYLIRKGINAQRLIAKGFGETQPIADNNTEEGRAKNRRTAVQVIKK